MTSEEDEHVQKHRTAVNHRKHTHSAIDESSVISTEVMLEIKSVASRWRVSSDNERISSEECLH